MPATSNSGTSCAQATVDKEDESDVMAYRARSHANEKTVRAPADQDVDAGALLAKNAFDGNGAERWLPLPPARPGHVHGDRNRHDDDIRALALSLDKPVDWTMFGIWLTMLLHRHGDEVLRVKGILNVADAETPVAVHGIQHLVHPPTHMTAWPDTDRRSRLVFIVKGLAPAAIERSLRAFSMTPTA